MAGHLIQVVVAGFWGLFYISEAFPALSIKRGNWAFFCDFNDSGLWSLYLRHTVSALWTCHIMVMSLSTPPIFHVPFLPLLRCRRSTRERCLRKKGHRSAPTHLVHNHVRVQFTTCVLLRCPVRSNARSDDASGNSDLFARSSGNSRRPSFYYIN